MKMKAKARERKRDGADLVEPILSGQAKWTFEANVVYEWSYIWELSDRCIKAKQDDLHDGLYMFITRRPIVPLGKEENGESKYSKCQQCKEKKWNPVHALIDCVDVQEAWKSAHEGLTGVSARDIFQIDMRGNKEERTISYGKDKKKKKTPTLSEKEVKILSTMKEIVDEVDRRELSRKEKKRWKQKSKGEWVKCIEERMSRVVRNQQERRKELEGALDPDKGEGATKAGVG